MNRIKLKSAASIDMRRTILETSDGGPVIRGDPDIGTAHICPSCDAILMAGIAEGSVRGCYLRCSICDLVSISG
jgi:hypothetical protein